MKTLYLLRHAKADSKTSAPDFMRELTPVGHNQAKELAKYWETKKYSVDYAICSAALRTHQTLEHLNANLGTTLVEVSKDFYGIEEDVILKYVRACQDNQDKVLYVGHNPGVAFFAMRMAINPPEEMTLGYVPCTLAVFELDIEKWSELEWHMGNIIDYWSPPKKSTET